MIRRNSELPRNGAIRLHHKIVIQKNEENTEVKTGCFPHFLISLVNCISEQVKVSGSKISILDGYFG